MHIDPSSAPRLTGPPTITRVRAGAFGALAVASLLAGCNNTSTPDGGTLPAGTWQPLPGSTETFIVDPNDGGLAPELRLQQTFFGRLVTVVAEYDIGGGVTERRQMLTNYVITPNDLGDTSGTGTGTQYYVETNAVTGAQTLVVEADVNTSAGLTAFQELVKRLGDQLRVVADNGFTGIGAYTMVPRNAAIVLQFADLLDPTTVSGQSIEVLVGVPTNEPYEARILVDPHHGDVADFNGDGVAEFYSTRVIVDTTVSGPEASQTSPPLPVNQTGLPSSENVLQSNVQIRMATRTVTSTDLLVENPSGHSLATVGNGSIDFGSGTRDIVRAVRAGGNQAVTGDPYNGYLRDDSPPRMIGALDVAIDIEPTPLASVPNVYFVSMMTFAAANCAQAPQPGDFVTMSGLYFEVYGEDAVLGANGQVMNVELRVEPADQQFFEANWQLPAQYLVAYDPNLHAPEDWICFLEISPTPSGYATGNPDEGVFPNSTYSVRFNEPMDPASLAVFDNLVVSRRQTPQEAIDYVPGTVQRSIDLQEFTFTPDLPLAHVQGGTEQYFMRVGGHSIAPSDLAGNSITATPGAVSFRLESTSAAQPTGGRVTRFSGPDEEVPRDGEPGDPTPELVELLPEWIGQHVYDVSRQIIRPRPVTRTQIVTERQGQSQSPTLPGAMFQQATGQTLPLNTFGAKMQMVWRWFDFDQPYLVDDRINANIDRTFLNIDVEGASLAPLSGGVIFESYPRFRMTMGHSSFLPDEVINPVTNAIVLPASGITNIYENNYVSVVEDPPTVVHEDFRGYQIVPADIFQTAAGTNLIPLPQNRGLTGSARRYYTWRDTSIQTRSGPNGFGVYPARWYQVKSAPGPVFPGPDMAGMLTDCNLPAAGTACQNLFNTSGNIQSAALPLLIEFDCFPSPGAQTQNTFDTNMAHQTQTVPFFRAFTSGGFDTQGNQIFVDPDLEILANGGFNPLGTPPGTTTNGTDNTFYIGGLDLVVRVSRSASLFFPAVNPLQSDGDPLTRDDTRFPNPTYYPAVLFPRAEDQPQGTSIVVHYRGASVIDVNHRSRVDATQMDPYGDFYPDREIAALNICDGSISHDPVLCDGMTVLENEGITFHTTDAWRENVAELNGAQFIQLHLTFTSDVDSGQSPSLSSLAVSWSQ